MSYTLSGAFLIAILPFAAAQWLLMWAIRFVPTPIRSQFIRAVIGSALAAVWFSFLIAQVSAYRHLTSIHNLSHDHVFMASYAVETIVGIFIVLKSASARQRNTKKAR